ncbi:hypothetical protein D515_02959 [Grimontia indica]|uniref:Uncharacterized protein n=1 Tax=Grimontia indica TaxID=1056512 RepID=R1GQ93_9GAMM|nr:hypothetical protein D515_02959 [Grimontia indica]
MANAISLQQRSPGLQIFVGIIDHKNVNAIENRLFGKELAKAT